MTAQKNAKKKSSRRKKKISKHVLKAKEAKGGQSAEATTNESRPAKEQKIKDPGDVQSYLESWKQSQSGESSNWKFNKNTQSWLIRHAYDPSRVPKNSFNLLLEYLMGLKGDVMKKRILADATRRALRYKDYEKSQSASNEAPSTGETNQDAKAGEENDNGKSKDGNSDAEDQIRWSKLDDHDKRKEYKRARRILECLTKE